MDLVQQQVVHNHARVGEKSVSLEKFGKVLEWFGPLNALKVQVSFYSPTLLIFL
jgi:hypothetical protein